MSCVLWSVAALALAGASTGLRDARPGWLDGDDLEWPRHRYVLGVGVADEPASAKDRARAEIARVFKSRVVARTASFEAEASETRQGKTTRTAAVSASDDTRTFTERELVGVEIAATWQDPASRQFHALAVLDRPKAVERVTAELAAIDAALRASEMERVRAADPVGAAMAGLRALAQLRRGEPLVQDLRLLDPGARVEEALHAAARDNAGAALGRLVIGLSVSGEGAQEVEGGIARGLADLGLRARAEVDPASADLVAEATCAVEELGRRDGWYWSRSTVNLSVRDVRSGRVVLQVNQTARASATVEHEAPRRSLVAVGDAVAKAVPVELWRWIEGN